MANSYQLNKPYPEPVGLTENRRAGRLLLRCYAGGCSEMTAANQYLYQYLQSPGGNMQLIQAFCEICEVERLHLALLGRVLRQLGVDPRFRVAGPEGSVHWSARHVNYAATVREMLLSDIAHEDEILNLYQQTAARIDNSQIRALIGRIMEDEQLHLESLRDLLNRYF